MDILIAVSIGFLLWGATAWKPERNRSAKKKHTKINRYVFKWRGDKLTRQGNRLRRSNGQFMVYFEWGRHDFSFSFLKGG